MKGITFGPYHSYNDFGLILGSKKVAAPKVKTVKIEIEGADSALDLTEYFGEPKYSNRELSFDFSTTVPQSQFMSLFSTIQNALHGQKMNIILDDDPEWYYTGRISVSEWKADKRIGKLSIDCDCEPFKHKLTAQAVNLCGNNLINLNSGTVLGGGAWTKTETGYTFTRGAATGGCFMYWSIPVAKGQQYTFSASYLLPGCRLYVYKDKILGTSVAQAASGNPCIFTAAETGIYVCGLYCISAAAEGTFENVMLQIGGTVGTYEAYDSSEKEVAATFSNTRKAAVPTGYVSGTIEMQSDSVSQVLSNGKQLLDSFIFYKGDNSFIFTGNGVVVVEWKEGGL